jgi:O-antigen/teichoic acid export membrane protein
VRKIVAAAFKTGSGSAGALAFGAIAVKTMALLLGPAGVGLFSLLRQTQQTLTLLGSFGGQTALVQGIASRDEQERAAFIGTSTLFFIGGSVFVVLVLLGLAPWMAPLLFGDSSANAVQMVRWLALPTVAGIATAFFTGVLNGHKAISAVAWIQVVAGFAVAAAAYPMARMVRLERSVPLVMLLGISLSASALYGLIVSAKHGWLRLPSSRSDLWHAPSARAFQSIGGTTVLTSVIATFAVLIIRAMVLKRQSLDAVGIFDVAWTLSMMYVMLILNSFNTYYLPTLSASRDDERRQLVEQTLRVCTLCMVPLVGLMIVCKPLLVFVLYSKQFGASLVMMRWMLIGDYLKITSWVLAIPMLAFADMKTFFWSELISNSFLIAASYFALQSALGLEGIGISFVLLYAFYLGYTLWYARSKLGFSWSIPAFLFWLGGFLLLCLVSYFCWNDSVFDWRSALKLLVTILLFDGFGIFLLNRDHRHMEKSR